MPAIDDNVKTSLEELLFSYYAALKNGELQTLAARMTPASYLITLESLGFKRSFRESRFKKLLKEMEDDQNALREVTAILGADLAEERRVHRLEIVDFESKGPDRVTIHYREDGNPRKLYCSQSSDGWKIDFKAGRPKT